MNFTALDVTIVGGGMITNDLILPSVYHLQRLGVVGQITIAGRTAPPLKALKENAEIRDAFPGQDFTAVPAATTPGNFPESYKTVLAKMPPRQAVIVAVPDWLHYPVVMDALHANQHVLCVKPLVHEYQQSVAIAKQIGRAHV